MSQQNPVSAGKPDPAAFKHYSTDFKRDVANLKSGNGDRRTVCGRLGAALAGMIANVTAVDGDTRYNTKEYLEKFYADVHGPILGTYTVDLSNTPLRFYKSQFDELYSIVRTAEASMV